MTDFARAVLANADPFRWIFFLALLWAFYRWMQTENGIEWRDFVSAEKPDGTYRGDINRVGQCFGVGVAVYAVVAAAPKAHTDFLGFAGVLAAALLFLCGPAGYAAFLRTKNSQVQTITVTEPVAPRGPVKTTETVTEPADPAVSGEPVPVKIVEGPGVDESLKVKETPHKKGTKP